MTLNFPRVRSERILKDLEGAAAQSSHISHLMTRDADIYDQSSGRLVARFRKGVINDEAVRLAKRIFRDIENRLRPSTS